MERRMCLNCFKLKPDEDFGWENTKNISKGKRSKCKICYTEIELRRFYESRLEKNPDDYWECDVCDHIVNKKRSSCNKCKEPRHSKNIPSALYFK